MKVNIFKAYDIYDLEQYINMFICKIEDEGGKILDIQITSKKDEYISLVRYIEIF